MINKLIKTKNGRILISIILGLGLSSIFRKVCKDRDCIIYRAPAPKNVKEQVYQFNGTCYRFESENVQCEGKTVIH